MPHFEDELIRLRPALLSFAYRLIGNSDSAEDLVQEVFLKALKAKASYMPGTNQMAWLCTIMKNTFITGLRKDGRMIYTGCEFYTNDLVCGENTLTDRLVLTSVLEALSSLPAEQATALHQSTIEGLQYDEIAALAGVPEGTIKSRVSRARRALREQCGEMPWDQSP